jgi:hypothetical protein
MSASNKTSAAKARTLERQTRALELRRAGLGYEAIAAQIGIGKSQAHRLVVAGLAESKAQIAASADDLRSEEISRLDGMLLGLWPRARKGEVAAVDRVLKIAERRAKLLGLDAPTKVAETDPVGNAVGPRRIELVAPGDDSPA